MNIEVRGFKGTEQTSIVDDFVRFCITFLFKKISTGAINVRVETDSTLIDRDRWAECEAHGTRSYPENFTVRVMPAPALTFIQQLVQIAHELVHLKQFHMGELVFNVKGRPKQTWWLGKFYPNTAFDDWMEPWELEARSMQKGLTEIFCDRNNYRRAPWYIPYA